MKNKILIVDDIELNRVILKEMFQSEYGILEAESGEEALEIIHNHADEIILVMLDLVLNGMSGFEVLEKRKDMDQFRQIPVAVITENTDIENQTKAFDLGANEYLMKPFDPVIVTSRIRNVLFLHQKMVEALSKVENLKEIVEHDEMTGILNKVTVEREINEILQKSKGSLDVLLVIDIDKFKSINDSFGHQSGDLVIKATAEMITNNFRKTDLVGRIGGDEFCVLMMGLSNIELARKKVTKLLHSVKYSLETPIPAFATISVGMASNNRENTSYEALFEKADAALYLAKENGRAQYREYGVDSQNAVNDGALGYQSPEEVLNAMLHFYMDEKNVEATMKCLTSDIRWIGTEETECAIGLDNLKKVLENSVKAFPHTFDVRVDDLDQQVLNEGLVQLMFNVRDKNEDMHNLNGGFFIRMSVCCEQTDNGWKIKSFHASTPSAIMETYALQKELDQNRKMEEILLSGITGGAAIYRLKKDGRIEADYVTKGVAKLFGYEDYKEFMSYYQKDARVNIPEEDQEILDAAIEKSIKTGVPICSIYHNYVKNGADVLQRMDANLMDAKLGEDDVAVWYAVHTKVSDETEKELKEQKRYRLILEILNVAYWEWSVKSGYYVSPKYYDYAISEADQNTVWTVDEYKKYVHPDDLQIMIDFINKEKSAENTAKAICRCKLKDGSFQLTEMYSFNEYGEDGQLLMVISAMCAVDETWIEQKKQLEDALEMARQV